ncbi:MAG TPA: hypothetical protein PKZ53_15825, partial [Acidobacteriota bacterium]|nr:hypothetical protein [Acidobacteriota bacterium]
RCRCFIPKFSEISRIHIFGIYLAPGFWFGIQIAHREADSTYSRFFIPLDTGTQHLHSLVFREEKNGATVHPDSTDPQEK